MPLPTSELLELARRLARNGQVERALQAYDRVRQDEAGSELEGQALIGIAGIQSDLGDV